jgi:DNA-binding transcriptional MerR regulator
MSGKPQTQTPRTPTPFPKNLVPILNFASQIVQTVAYTATSARFPTDQRRPLLMDTMASQLSQKRAPESPTIPDRLYFKIGDVARICGLETYVLRFWESQFPQLKPNKGGTGQRLYRRREVELVLEIKRLVHTEGYTLPGARHVLEQQSRRPSAPAARTASEIRTSPELQSDPGQQPSRLTTPGTDSARLDAVAATIGHARAELRELAAMLAAPAQRPARRRPRIATLSHAPNSLFPG